jgi:hypothetical protein
VRFIVSGAAPLAEHVEEFLRAVSCAFMSQGYGNNFLSLITLPVYNLGYIDHCIGHRTYRCFDQPKKKHQMLCT